MKSEKINVPVMSVGNLSTGGTGKTPMVDFIINNLKRDYNISVLSRGYNRKSKGFIEIKNSDNPSLVGASSKVLRTPNLRLLSVQSLVSSMALLACLVLAVT